MKNLRFAPIIRVSTEKQKGKGESLRTQRTQIEQFVKSLNGTIPDHCWQYVGQEHATPDAQRQNLEKLLHDSSEDLFDAVIVCDASRWSRDNQRSKEGLEILKTNGIKFFIGTSEYDLNHPEHRFFIGISTEINEMQSGIQVQKSVINRIHRAKRGIPTSGRLPYGRVFDRKKNVWGIEPEKKAIIENAAERYLAGEGIVDIATTHNMNPSNLHKILTKRSGNKWDIRIRCKKFNIDETITMEIPRLLPENIIQSIKSLSDRNRTFTHGELKYPYLLRRYIFCGYCGFGYFGQTNRGVTRYYRHSRNNKDCEGNKNWLTADKIENAVLIEIIRLMGDRERFKKSIEAAIPNLDAIKKMEAERDELIKELEALEKQKDNVIDMVAEGIICKDDVEKKMNQIKDKQSTFSARINTINNEITNRPTDNQIKKVSKLGAKVGLDASKHTPELILKRRSYKWKQNLIEDVFSGTDSNGNKNGIYIKNISDRNFSYELRGSMGKVFGKISPSEIKPEHQETDKSHKSQNALYLQGRGLRLCRIFAVLLQQQG